MLTLFLIKFSYLLDKLEIPDNIRRLLRGSISHEISLTWGHDDMLNLRLRDCDDRFHVSSTVEFNLITLDDNKISSLGTPHCCSVTLNVLFSNVNRCVREVVAGRIMPVEMDFFARLIHKLLSLCIKKGSFQVNERCISRCL